MISVLEKVVFILNKRSLRNSNTAFMYLVSLKGKVCYSHPKYWEMHLLTYVLFSVEKIIFLVTFLWIFKPFKKAFLSL